MARKVILQDPSYGATMGGYPPPDNGVIADLNANFIELYAGSGGGGGGFPGYLAPAQLAAGETDNYNPGSTWPLSITRLDITPGGGGSNLTGLVAATDGVGVIVFNPSAADSLTLNNQNTSSAAANRFQSAGDFVLPPGDGVLIVYYGGSVNRWRIVP